MSTTTEVTQKDLHVLLEIFEKKSYEAGSCEEGSLEADITRKCEYLFKKDYTIVELDNTNGVLSPRYPGRIFIPEHEHGHMASTLTITTSNNATNNTHYPNSSNATPQNSNDLLNNTACCNGTASTTAATNNSIHAYVTFANSAMQQNQQQQHQQQQITNTSNNTIYEDSYDVGKIRELITMAKYARCRQRFVVPVLMYRGKLVCRSATISINAETYGRKVVDYAYDCLNGTNYSERGGNPGVDDENNDNVDSLMNHALNEPSPFSYEEVIKSDIQLLNALNVTTIMDLMVEKRKIKYFMAVSSSEKADPENHYEHFNILSLPYPGCEFFKKFRDNNYLAKNLHYNWSQSFNDATVSIPKLDSAIQLNINWDEYKNWDLVLITQNYLKACLKYIKEEKKGILIHCISGWDRTPLFISLVRLSLWADGLVHQSLNALQMVYLTLAYDWYLFGHQLPDRLRRGEDIMFFCFHVLKYIADDEFSIIEQRKRTKTSSSSGSAGSAAFKFESYDEEPKEDFILGCEQDSNESFSNSSICEMSIIDNHYATAAPTTTTAGVSGNNIVAGNPLTNRSPNPKRSKTSPISVPGTSAARQRHESTSSTGSWYFINEAGSVDSTMNGSYMRSQQDSNGSDTSNASGNKCSGISNNCSNTPSYASNNSASSSNGALNNVTNNLNGKDDMPLTKAAATLRKQRLNAVRAIFIQSYGKTVGLKFREGSAMNLTSFIGTLAEQLF